MSTAVLLLNTFLIIIKNDQKKVEKYAVPVPFPTVKPDDKIDTQKNVKQNGQKREYPKTYGNQKRNKKIEMRSESKPCSCCIMNQVEDLEY